MGEGVRPSVIREVFLSLCVCHLLLRGYDDAVVWGMMNSENYRVVALNRTELGVK
jgi:hypothetical protein